LLGRYSEALEHIEKGSALYAAHHNHRYSVFGNFDSKVMFECFAALALLPLGYPDQSAQKIAAGLALARKLGHPQTLVVALHIAAQLHHLRCDAALVLVCAKDAMELADEYGLAVWVMYGLIELGWAEAELGDAQDGIEKMQRGLAEYEVTGAKLRSPYFLGMLADQLGNAGRVQEGLFAITRALSIAEQTGEGYGLAELHRIKGELFWRSIDLVHSGVLSNKSCGEATLSQARACFTEALTVAKQQRTRSWELRAALSMHRLEVMFGNPNITQLAEIYSSFTEGFETHDLRVAKAILEGTSPTAIAQ
jgi:predicted ATPase